MKNVFLLFLMGIGFGLFAQPSNDNQTDAIILTNLSNWTSNDGVYTNVGATIDGTGGTCGGPYRNVWFKFQATTSEIEIKMQMGGAKGTLGFAVLTLFNAAGTVIACHTNQNEQTTYIQHTSLTPGQWYYFSADDMNTPGTFSLTVTDNIGYDLKAKAEHLTNIHAWTSADGAYSNVNATIDGTGGACGGPYRNVWFKFQATTSEIEIKMQMGGTKGTLRFAVLTLFNAAGTAMACHTNQNEQTTYIQHTSLTPGQWYYFSADDMNTPGTFSLTVTDNIGYDLKAKAEHLTNIHAWTSADGAYSNVNATIDGTGGTCGGPYRNVWFKFQATTSEIEIKMQMGGTKGTLRFAVLTLFNAAGTVMACHTNQNEQTAYIQHTSLTTGQWYYFSADDVNTGGTFSLSVADKINFDTKVGAEIIPHETSWCTSEGQYSNIDATPDGINNSSCGNNIHNVWFKFQATSQHINIKLLTGSTKGTLNYPVINLLDENSTIIKCHSNSGYQTAEIDFTTLEIGSWYFLSVDHSTGNTGTFTLCIEGGAAPSQFCESIFCDGEGNVGIGTPIVAMGYKLSVKGKIMSEGVKVQLQSHWPDYVFDKNYDLQTLEQLKKYIGENGHLPKLPAAEQVKKEGMDLGAINVLLVEKIEELTLHMIKLEERLKKMEEENKKLRTENK